jgi:3',5'-cyclic AMP phosphodiesterase CpdA
MNNRRDFFKKAALLAGSATMLPNVLLEAREANEPFRTDKKRVLRVAHITDVHILNKRNAETCFARVIDAINRMDDRPDFIINTGDTVMDENKQTLETVEARWEVWRKIVANNDLPIHSALGNHDVWYGPDKKLDDVYQKDARYGKQWAMNELGLKNRYYSFSSNGWKFIALDSINGDHGYQLDKEQFRWLEFELNTAGIEPVCVFNHVPILSMGALLYSTKRTPVADVKFPSGDMHNDHQQIKDLFLKKQNVKLCLSGHVHYVDGIEYLGVKYLCNGAVSGNWWGDPIALEEFPPVYAIIDLFDDGTTENRLVYYNTKI